MVIYLLSLARLQSHVKPDKALGERVDDCAVFSKATAIA